MDGDDFVLSSDADEMEEMQSSTHEYWISATSALGALLAIIFSVLEEKDLLFGIFVFKARCTILFEVLAFCLSTAFFCLF